MRRRRTICCLLALAALLLGAPTVDAAQASPPAPRLLTGLSRLNDELALMGQGSSAVGLPRNLTLSELRFENRDGYRISVVAFGQTVALSVSRSLVHRRGRGDRHRRVRQRVSVATYFAHGKVTPTSIAASFGDRGRIAVRFRPSGRALHATHKAGCRRPSNGVIADFGVFDGELHFEGEGGYTSVDVHHMPGRSVDFASLLACLLGLSPGGHAALPQSSAPLGIRLPGLVAADPASASGAAGVPTHPGIGPKSTTLVADSKQSLARTVFAAQVRGRGRPHFLAVSQVSEGSIGVIRFAYVRGAPSAFSFDGILSSATAAPPPPFDGSADLLRGPRNAKSWSGSLAVSFLGAPHLPLTGPPFGAWLSQGF